MKALTIIFVSVLAILSACILIPSPNLALLLPTIAAPELSPWLVLLNLLAGLAALRFYRPLLPLAAASLLVSGWPLVQIHNVAVQSSNKGAERMQGIGDSASILLDCFRSTVSWSVQPQRLAMNILYYPPPNGGRLRPALIDIYGGAWQHGSPADLHRFDSYLALKGFPVFAIDYRHAPEFKFPVQLNDVNAAVSFIYQNATRYNVDRDRLVLCGRSAGAQLALLAAYETGLVPVRGVVSYYGPTDLIKGYFDLPTPDPINVRAVLEAYLGGSPAQVPNAYRDASPVTYMRRSLPATLILQGERDHIVKEVFARELYARLSESGNRAYLVEIPWSEHGFDFAFPGLGNHVSLRYLEQFLHETVGS